ncbi:hypothetical protein [Flexithrix dorotheae]|uniref:hypothetical protein n=1 Tax=Flexithrix dorotheae TaxID=70993 RepID=UPI0003A01717|nr:hypothetical protein [Flexithrix dorotheae]
MKKIKAIENKGKLIILVSFFIILLGDQIQAQEYDPTQQREFKSAESYFTNSNKIKGANELEINGGVGEKTYFFGAAFTGYLGDRIFLKGGLRAEQGYPFEGIDSKYYGYYLDFSGGYALIQAKNFNFNLFGGLSAVYDQFPEISYLDNQVNYGLLAGAEIAFHFDRICLKLQGDQRTMFEGKARWFAGMGVGFSLN